MNDTAPSITLGAQVEVDLKSKNGKSERLAFQIVADREADFAAGRLSENAPLARALLGKQAGDRVPYHQGDLVEVAIVSVTPGPEAAPPAPAADREERLRHARSQAELGNLISFALTFDSKWGDYDPEAIAEQWEEEERGKKQEGAS